jgi:uncharacterized protein YktA (UPF0223 family)
MALNTRLANLVSTSTDLASLGSSVISLGSQILEKGMMYISGEKPERGISGFMLDVVKETVVEMNSEITDYPLEMDYQVQSHFSRRPVMINVTGVCSDIRVHDPNDEWDLEALLDDLTEMVEKLNMISQRLNMGATAKECARVVAFMKTIHTLYSKVKETYNRVKKVMKLLGKDFGEKDKTSSQINAYETLKEMWKSGRELKIETPWEVYEHCVIESLSFTQPEETNHQTNISIRFKQLTLTTVDVGLFGTKIDSKVAQQLAQKSTATNGKASVKYEGKIYQTGKEFNTKQKRKEQERIKNKATKQ